jgi:sulfite exporter TauE/SafE
MLSSITPLGERGRHNTYAVTVAMFAVAAVLAGAAAGAITGLAGAIVIPAGLPGRWRVVAGALLVAACALIDSGRGGTVVPSPRRQVDERWLRAYRRWVYACGYAAQLGVGLVTYVTSSAVYTAYAFALLSRSPVLGAAIIAAHGAGRAASLAASWSVRSQTELLRVHARLLALEAPARRVVVALQAGAAVALALVAATG